MKLAMARSVAEKLEENPDVLATDINQDRDVTVTAVVPNRYAERRVKRELHQYPLYVELEVQDSDAERARP